MGDEKSGTVHAATEKGTVASHPDVEIQPFLVAPTVAKAFNALALDLNAVACLSLHDVLFAFDSSFVNPDAGTMLKELPGLREKHKNKRGEFPPVSVFGHADPVGSDSYNKILSGRRARAIYGALIRDAAVWEDLYTHPFHGDKWAGPQVVAMLEALGYKPAPGDGLLTTPKDQPGSTYFVNNKSDILIKFQSDKKLSSDGYLNASTRRPVFEGYMDKLCGFKLQKSDFLGRGADPDGVADIQGCSDFNPLLLLSRNENDTLPHPKRNQENQPNRRVVVFLFCPGRKINTKLWPCPAWSGGSAACKKRFFANGEQRRTPAAAARREFAKTHDTFACRFYDRIAHLSPCESPVPPVPLLLKLTKVDDHFAPSVENLDFVYNIGGLAGRAVKLRILAENYKGNTCLERDLTAEEKKDASGKPLTWDGKCTTGDRKDRFATPLMGPFKVQLFADDKLKDELPFKILYHSIELSFGKHTPDGALPPEAEREKFVQAKLNELGYDAGPVDGTIGTTAHNALRRFQRANYKAATQQLLAVTGNIDDDTFAAIKAATPREIFEAGKTPLTQDCKFYVYDNFINDPTMDFVTGNTPEFNSTDRKQYAEDKMERPYIALEAEVKLLNKAGNGVSAPDAAGDVPVAWEMDDAAEDASVITHATGKTYVQHAREIGTTAAVAGAARIDQDGDNALDTFEGFRKGSAADYVKSMFPNDAPSKLEPYAIDRYDRETRGGKDFHRALVKAWDDASKNPRCKGHAGVYFRFSMKGGDDAKVRTALSFKGLPNEKQLEKDHEGVAGNLAKETGRWTIWRRTRISAYCTQVAAPPRASGLPNFGTIRDRWKEAFIDVENNGQPTTNPNYAAVVTQAVYNATILAMPATHRPAGVTNAASLHYSPTCIYGGRAIAQNPGETAAHYITRAENAMSAWSVNPINAILKVIHDEARKTSPEGFVIFDFRIHDPITGQDPQPGGGFAPSANPSVQNQIASTAGYVRCAGAVTMNVDNPFNVSCYLCHECGHGRFLYHHITQDQANPGVSDNPTHHDASQARCIMSYGIGADTPNGWDYPFCGKCLLRLRGWKVTTLPNQYT
jgi:hypothetical protein